MRRNIDEFKAEVFRRREQRILRQKRQRRKTILCCVPLAICIIALSWAFQPGNVAQESDKQDDKIAQESIENAYVTIVSVEVKADYGFGEYNRTYTAQDEVKELVAALEEITETGPVLKEEIAEGYVDSDLQSGIVKEENIVSKDFIITLTDSSGAITQYVLTDDGLYICAEETLLELSADDVEELKKLFTETPSKE